MNKLITNCEKDFLVCHERNKYRVKQMKKFIKYLEENY